MVEKNSIFSLRKNPKGEIILEFSPEIITFKKVVKGILLILLKVSTPIFSFFDFLASKRKLVISSIGLGIGLGLSVLVTQRPDTIQAFPQLSVVNNFNIRVERIVISSIDLSVNVVTGNVQNLVENIQLGELVHDERSSELGSSNPVVVADVGIKNILVNLESVKIGDEIQIQGSNNATYRFKVSEIRDIKAEYLPNVIGSQEESLILYKSKNVLRTKLYILIAKPVK